MEDTVSAVVAASDLNVQEERKRARYAAFASGDAPSGVVTVRPGYRPPMRFGDLLAFFRTRALAGVELVDEGAYARAVRLPVPSGGEAAGWVRVADDPGKDRLAVTMSDELAPCVPQVIARVRRMFDADCDPQAVAAGLSALDQAVPGALVAEQMERLLAIKGVGPWTANYIAMRVLSHPDAFLESDAGVAHALPDLTPKQRLALAEPWRPWRSYAVIMLWNSLEA